jgi:CRP-like cAMP-binding protein
MHQTLLQNIAAKGINLNPEETELIESLFHPKKYRKNQYILQQGDVARYENFIIKGITRVYLVDDKGQEHVVSFRPEQWWVGDLYSFYTGMSTSFNVDCLEDTEVLQITRPDLDLLCDRVPKMDTYFKLLYRGSMVVYNDRVASSLCKTAQQRYQEFNVQKPQIEQPGPH